MDADDFRPLHGHLRGQLLSEGMMTESDLGLVHITNDVDEAVERV
jgi:hypothetical protein